MRAARTRSVARICGRELAARSRGVRRDAVGDRPALPSCARARGADRAYPQRALLWAVRAWAGGRGGQGRAGGSQGLVRGRAVVSRGGVRGRGDRHLRRGSRALARAGRPAVASVGAAVSNGFLQRSRDPSVLPPFRDGLAGRSSVHRRTRGARRGLGTFSTTDCDGRGAARGARRLLAAGRGRDDAGSSSRGIGGPLHPASSTRTRATRGPIGFLRVPGDIVGGLWWLR